MQSEQEINNEKKIENELFNSLKFYGYLFPGTVQQVGEFEKLPVDSKRTAPGIEQIFLMDQGFSFPESFDMNLSMAAYSNEEDLFPGPSDEASDDSDDPDAPKGKQ